MIFVWALATSYLIASDLRPDLSRLFLLVVSGYLLTFGIYVLNALQDIEEDRINSPLKPIVSGKVPPEDAEILLLLSIASSLAISAFISITTFTLFAISLFLGIAYSLPRIGTKRSLSGKLLVTASGAMAFSLTGGIAAQNLNATIFFAAVAFALFALVTLLLGDIADMKGDLALHVRSLPLVLGPHRAVVLITVIPIVLSALGVALFRFTNFNLIFPILLFSISAYSSLTITGLFKNYNDLKACRRIKQRMRIVHFLLQLTFILGLLPI